MIVVVADDITGAAEIAGKAMEFGLRVRFICTFDGNLSVSGNPDILVIATNTRSYSEEEALTFNQLLARSLNHTSFRIFKKCDSVLRGYVLTELLPFARSANCTQILLQPANPEAGRCIVNGRYTINNQELHHTAFKDDPDFPATTSLVSQLLKIRNPLFFQSGNIDYKISDCSTGNDMQVLLSNADRSSTLFAGSTAFFGHYLKYIHGYEPKSGPIYSTGKPTIPFLLIAGSTHTSTSDTEQYFRDIKLTLHALPSELRQNQCSTGSIHSFATALEEQWKQNPEDGILLTIGEPRECFPQAAERLNERLCMTAKHLIAGLKLHSIYCTGGATTWQLIQEMRWTNLVPLHTLAPGVIRFEVENSPGTVLTIKPGSYSWGIRS